MMSMMPVMILMMIMMVMLLVLNCLKINMPPHAYMYIHICYYNTYTYIYSLYMYLRYVDIHMGMYMCR